MATIALLLPVARAQTAEFNGAVNTLGSGFNSPTGVAVDARGDVFVADSGSSPVKEIVAVGGVVSSTSAIKTVGSGIVAPYGVAVDASGNVFVTDQSSGTLKEIVAVGGVVSSTSTVKTIASGFNSPAGVAVDSSGNVFVADSVNNAVKEVVAVGGVVSSASTVAVVGSGFGVPLDVAVDDSGDVYVADALHSAVKEIVAVGGVVSSASTVNTLAGGFSLPLGVAVDRSGNVYVTEYGGNAVKKIPLGCASSSCVITMGSGLNNPYGVAVDASGNIYVADKIQSVVQEVMPGGVNFGPVAAGTVGTPYTLYFTLVTGGTMDTPTVLTQGTAGLDFTDAGTGTCTTNGTSHIYSAGDSCTVDVTFKPTVAGTRDGAVNLLNSSGAVIATAHIYGTGIAPQIAFSPATQSTLGASPSLKQPLDAAVDASGNVYVVDYGNNALYEILAVNGSIPASPTIDTINTSSSSLSHPKGVAVDGSGNIYIADSGHGSVKEILAVNGSIPANPTIKTLGGGFVFPEDVAVDGSGNVFVTDFVSYTANNAVYEMAPDCTSSACVTRLGSSFFNSTTCPQGIAVDGSDNVFVADFCVGAVYEIQAVNGSIPASPVITELGGSNFLGSNSAPTGVAVDAAGDVYVGDIGNDAVEEIVAVNGSIPASPTLKTLSGNFAFPQSVALDSRGNIYVADDQNDAVYELNYASPPNLSFLTTLIHSGNSSDSPHTVTIANIGNAALTFPLPTVGDNPSVPANFAWDNASTCAQTDASSSTPYSLAAGSSCNIAIDFAPVSVGAPLTGNVVLTDNNLNNGNGTLAPIATATQSIALSGTAIPPTPSSSTTSSVIVAPSPAVAGSSVTVTVTLDDASGNAINGATASFSSTSTTASFGIPSVSGNVFTVTMTDSVAETVPISITLGSMAVGTLSGSAQFVAPAYVVTVDTDPASGNGTASNCVDPNISTSGNTNCSLRDAVAAADALTGVTANISFSGSAVGTAGSPAVILIAQGTPITITQSVNLNGPGANRLTVEGGTAANSSTNNQIFDITSVGPVALSGLTVANGYSDTGGAISETGSGSLTVTNSTFSGNSAYTGGAAISARSLLTVRNSTFSGDGSRFYGGAIYANSSMTVSNSTFSGNSASSGYGGAIYAQSSLTVSNSTFSGNAVVYNGGAIIAQSSLTVSNSTFSGNSSSFYGGAISAVSSFTVTNSIFTGDSASSGGSAIYAQSSGTVTSSVYNGDTFTGVTPTSSINADPKLSALGNYGGPTPTMLPLPGSAAICAGTQPMLNSTPLTTDQRGVAISPTRYGQTACYDIGAVQTTYSLGTAFTVQPPSVIAPGVALNPSPAVTVTENGLAVSGATINLSAASGTADGTTSATSAAGTGLATFSGLSITGAQPGDALTATLTITPTISVSVTSSTFVSLVLSAPATLTGQAGVAYSQSASAVNGTAPYRFAVTGGTLPPGLAMSSAGLISGTPAAVGSFPVTVTVTDANHLPATVNFTLEISAPAIVVSPSTLTALTVGTAPSLSFAASGGTAPYTYSNTGTLPVGLTLNAATGVVSGMPTTAGSYSFTITATDSTTGPAAPYSGSQLYAGTVGKGSATVSFTTATLSQTYTGSPLAATATTSPAGLTVDYTYNGSSTAPTAAGSYIVVATINDPNYTGTTTGTLVIGKAAATVTLSGLSQTYTGLPLTATATTSPAGLTVGFTYNGSSTEPTAAGSYAVIGTINDPNYSGTATGTLVIGKATATVTLSGLSQTYTGLPLTATATTSPAGLTVGFTYNGSSPEPTAVGSYAVIGTINDPNYSGTATGTLVVGKAALTISANNVSRAYGTANPTFSGSITGKQSGDTFSESFGTSATLTSPPSTYPIVPVVTGTNLSNYTQTVTDGTLTVTQAPTTTALTLSSKLAAPGQSVTMTAQVASATTGTPTGRVSFYDGALLLNTATLSGGAATYSTASLAPGVAHVITAVYSGDTNFTGSSSVSTASTTVNVAPLDFTMTIAGPSNATVIPGRSISYQVTVTPDYGEYAGTVHFAVSGLPPGATATFSPATIAANGGSQTITVTIRTAPLAVAAEDVPATPGTGRHAAPFALGFVLLLGLGGIRRRGLYLKRMVCLAVLLVGGAAATLMLNGCAGGRGFFTQPSLNYTVTITASGGGLQHSATVTLNLQ